MSCASHNTTQLWTNLENSIQYNSPVLKNGLVFGYSARDTLFCINARDGKTAWTSAVPGKRGYRSIVDAGSVLLLLTPIGNLIAFEPSDKEFKQLASYNVGEGDTTAHPVIAGNQVFGAKRMFITAPHMMMGIADSNSSVCKISVVPSGGALAQTPTAIIERESGTSRSTRRMNRSGSL